MGLRAGAAISAGSSQSARTIRTFGGVAVLIAAVVFWNFGTLSPCGVLREAARQNDSLASVLPDSIVDLGLAGQYGPLSTGRCLAVLIKNLSTPILSTAQASRAEMMQPVPRPAPVPPRHNSGNRTTARIMVHYKGARSLWDFAADRSFFIRRRVRREVADVEHRPPQFGPERLRLRSH